MFSEDRIRIMNELAFFENGNGKQKIRIAGYYRKDYVGLKMISTLLWLILGYALLLMLGGVVFFEVLLKHLSIHNMIQWGIAAAVGFVVLLIIYMIMAYRHFSRKHRNAVRDVKEYYALLRRLERMYKQEEKERAFERTLVDWEETDR